MPSTISTAAWWISSADGAGRLEFLFPYLQDSIVQLLLIAAAGGLAVGAVMALVIGKRRGGS